MSINVVNGPTKDGMYAPLVTGVLHVAGEPGDQTYKVEFRGAILSKTEVTIESIDWDGLECHVNCSFGDPINSDKPNEAALFYFNSESTSSNPYSLDDPITATAYTRLADTGIAQGTPVKKTSRGTVVRVQTGSGGK